ncbi:hypothetical protein ACMA1I_22215 [Pontibacter sp. 13R65]|uniref:hypothetical protein n=1 Tax=Pontibacter sp. 13R65 TaxID=3127458 RepID=UPI00301CF31E
MKYYNNYIIVILLLALVLNWVVDGSSFMDKASMNLGLMPKFTIIVIEILQALVILRILLFHYKNNFIMKTVFAVTVFCIFEFVVLKAMNASILIWISGIRYYFSFFPLFILSYLLAIKGYSITREFKWLIILILIQIPVTIYQFFNTSSVYLDNIRQPVFDMISGTMGGNASNLLSLVLGIGLLYFLIKFVEDKKLIFLFLSIALLVPPLLAEAKGMLILIIIALLYLALIFKFSFSRLLVLGVLATFLIIGFTYVYSLLGYAKELSVSYLIDYTSGESGKGRLSRIDSVVHSFNLLFQNDALLFGIGIGNSNKSPLGQDGQFYDFFTVRHSLDILITETGLMGLTIFTIILGKLISISKKLLASGEFIRDKDNLVITKVFLGTILFFIFGLGWVDVLFRVQFMYPFGMMAGYIIGLYHKIQITQKERVATYYHLQT